MNELNPVIWFSQRELNYKPEHFVTCKVPCSDEAKEWVVTKCTGRYTFYSHGSEDYEIVFLDKLKVAFEDPKEAMLFELTWG